MKFETPFQEAFIIDHAATSVWKETQKQHVIVSGTCRQIWKSETLCRALRVLISNPGSVPLRATCNISDALPPPPSLPKPLWSPPRKYEGTVSIKVRRKGGMGKFENCTIKSN